MRGASGDDPDGTDDADDADEPSEQRSASGSTAGGRGSDEDPNDSGAAAGTAGSSSEARTESAADAATGESSAAPGESNTDSGNTHGVDATDIDPSELTVSERSLHPRIRTLWIVRAVIWALVLGAIAAAVTWQWLEVGLILPAAITAVLLVLFVAHAILRYRAWQYEFREDAIYLERGVLTRVRTVVPFVRIQHIDTARGPIDRAAGLSTLVVYTAGSRGADVTIPGIEAERATDHQRRLKQLAIAAEDDTAV